MIRVLKRNESEFACADFQFTVSMYQTLNVELDDGFHGIRDAKNNVRKWFTLSPMDNELVLRIGKGCDILDEYTSSQKHAAELIRLGIRHLST